MSPRMALSFCVAGALALGAAIAIPSGTPARAGEEKKAADRAFTDAFPEDPKDFASTGRNTYFILEPGYDIVLGGTEKGKHVELAFRVLEETRVIDGVETRVVEERETSEGHLKDLSRNFFVISKRTGNVYYFGEEEVGEDGKPKDAKDAWLSGKKGARYGLFMPAVPLVGARFYNEVAPGVGMDRMEILDTAGTLETPAGKLTKVVALEETTPLDPEERDEKRFAPDIGLVQDGKMKLERCGVGAAKAPAK